MDTFPQAGEPAVVIVGAGPTGLALAHILGMNAVPTLLVERNPSTVVEPRAVSIDDESLRTLQYLGLYEAFRPRMIAGYGSHYFSATGRCFARVLPDGAEYGFPRRSAFRQPVLEALLRETLSRYPSVRTRFSTRLDRVGQSDGRVHGLLIPSGDADERRAEPVRCRYLAACDGARSGIRESLGIGMRGSTYDQRWLIVDLKGSTDPFRHTRVYCDPARPALALPGPEGTRRYEFMMRPGEDEAALREEANVRAMLGRHSRVDAGLEIVRRVVYQFHARIAECWRDGGIFLCGDAAHLSPPFAGQGMNSGLRDAHNLGWKLAACLRGELGEGLLETYEQERAPHAWALIQMAVNMGRVMMPLSGWNAFWVQNAFRVLSLYPPARDYVMQMKYKPKPRFDCGFVAGAAGAELRGRMFPQPVVERADGARCGLDDALGTGFAVLEWHDHQLPLSPAAQMPLGARQIRIIPKDHRFVDAPGGPGGVLLRDATGLLEQSFARAKVRGVVLRPDRYVAAALERTAGPGAARALLERLVSETGPRAEAPLQAGGARL
jgi:3-(3-hydroxy-phenyl)propionate hydroxylase